MGGHGESAQSDGAVEASLGFEPVQQAGDVAGDERVTGPDAVDRGHRVGAAVVLGPDRVQRSPGGALLDDDLTHTGVEQAVDAGLEGVGAGA